MLYPTKDRSLNEACAQLGIAVAAGVSVIKLNEDFHCTLVALCACARA